MPRLDKIAGSHTPVEGLMPPTVARRLQADYIARNPNRVGEKNKLEAAPGGSRYDAVHARYHPVLKRAAETVGFYDINLLDSATGDVVCTVAKETTSRQHVSWRLYSVRFRPCSTTRARSPQRRQGRRRGLHGLHTIRVRAAVVLAVPIIAEGQTIGVFVAQIDILTLNNLLTDNGLALDRAG